MRELLDEAREFGLATAAAAALLLLGAAVTYLSGSLLAGGFTTLLLGLPAIALGVWGLAGLVIASTLTFLAGVPLGEYGRVTLGDQAAVTWPEAALRSDLVRLEVTEARVDTARAVRQSHRHSGGKSSSSRVHAIAPIVPTASRPGEPVHVYAACRDLSSYDSSCRDAWASTTDVLMRVPAGDEPCYRRLLSADAPAEVAFVYWDRPERYLGQRWHEWSTALRVTAIAWLVIGAIILLYRAVARFRRR